MEELKPLIDAAAYWIAVDINIRLMWNTLGGIAAVAAITVATYLGIALSKRIERL